MTNKLCLLSSSIYLRLKFRHISQVGISPSEDIEFIFGFAKYLQEDQGSFKVFAPRGRGHCAMYQYAG